MTSTLHGGSTNRLDIWPCGRGASTVHDVDIDRLSAKAQYCKWRRVIIPRGGSSRRGLCSASGRDRSRGACIATRGGERAAPGSLDERTSPPRSNSDAQKRALAATGGVRTTVSFPGQVLPSRTPTDRARCIARRAAYSATAVSPCYTATSRARVHREDRGVDASIWKFEGTAAFSIRRSACDAVLENASSGDVVVIVYEGQGWPGQQEMIYRRISKAKDRKGAARPDGRLAGDVGSASGTSRPKPRKGGHRSSKRGTDCIDLPRAESRCSREDDLEKRRMDMEARGRAPGDPNRDVSLQARRPTRAGPQPARGDAAKSPTGSKVLTSTSIDPGEPLWQRTQDGKRHLPPIAVRVDGIDPVSGGYHPPLEVEEIRRGADYQLLTCAFIAATKGQHVELPSALSRPRGEQGPAFAAEWRRRRRNSRALRPGDHVVAQDVCTRLRAGSSDGGQWQV